MGMPSRALSYLRRNGAVSTYYAVKEYLLDMRADKEYRLHGLRKVPGPGELIDKAEHVFDKGFMISIIVPVFDPDMNFFMAMAESVRNQCYGNFELIMADGGYHDCSDEPYIKNLCKSDSRFKYRRISSGGGISANTNAGLEMAAGDFVAFLDQDDFIEPDTLYEIVMALQGGADIVYTDEDKFNDASGYFQTPNRKPGYNRELLLTNNYICHMFAVRRSTAESAGGFRSEFDGAQDYDFILRCTEAAAEDRIVHVPQILYHWRIHGGSTAGNPASKTYAYDAGKRALESYFERNSLQAAVTQTQHLGFYRITYTGAVPKEAYRVVIDGKLTPLTKDYEKVLSSYFVRPDIGIAGARIIGRTGRILCNGYHVKNDGMIESKYLGMDTHLSGYMHRAMLQQDTKAVSNHACIVRTELFDCIETDSYKTCRNIRERGYAAVLDPAVVFRE